MGDSVAHLFFHQFEGTNRELAAYTFPKKLIPVASPRVAANSSDLQEGGAAMIEGLLWIVGAYAAAIATVHTIYRMSRRTPNSAVHYVLLTRNNQHHMEWFLRSLFFFSWMRGKPISVTIMDDGSTDDTLEIAQRVGSDKEVEIQIETGSDAMDTFMAEHLQEAVVVVKLSGVEDIKSLPMLMQ
jgi:hypothetical protein